MICRKLMKHTFVNADSLFDPTTPFWSWWLITIQIANSYINHHFNLFFLCYFQIIYALSLSFWLTITLLTLLAILLITCLFCKIAISCITQWVTRSQKKKKMQFSKKINCNSAALNVRWNNMEEIFPGS